MQLGLMATQARKLVPGILVNMEILETKELPDQLWVIFVQ